MKVYVVTAGDYSDYHVVTVFTSEKKADAFVSLYNRSTEYESATVDEYDADSVKVNGFTFFVSKNLDTSELHAYTISEEYDDAVVFEDSFRRGDFIGPAHLITHVFTDSLEKAKKIALDRFTAYEAREAGI